MGDNLDEVFVEVPPTPRSDVSTLEWTLDHFDNDKIKIILVPYSDARNPEEFPDEAKIGYFPRCAEKQFTVDTLVPAAVGISFDLTLRELVDKHGMKKFVAPAAKYTISESPKSFLQVQQNRSCKIWFVKEHSQELFSTVCYGPGNDEMISEISGGEDASMVEEEIRRREEALVLQNENLQKKVKEETRRHENAEKELSLKIVEAKTNYEKEIDILNRKIDQLEQKMALSTTFTFEELDQATESFSDSLKFKEGHSGYIYKGTIRGTTVAIKKFKTQRMPSLSVLQQEIFVLSIRHPYIVTLIGACLEPPTLVYEFLSRGSLRDYLNPTGNTRPLSWQVRARIIGEICVALIFLHSNKPNPIVHGDLRPDNILLDSNLTSKLTGFHLTDDTRPLVYTDPEYSTTKTMTPEYDVYSFGVLILHLLTGSCSIKIRQTVEKTIRNDKLYTIIDKSADNWPLHHAKEVAEIGVLCANDHRSNRPDLVNGVLPIVKRLVTESL